MVVTEGIEGARRFSSGEGRYRGLTEDWGIQAAHRAALATRRDRPRGQK